MHDGLLGVSVGRAGLSCVGVLVASSSLGRLILAIQSPPESTSKEQAKNQEDLLFLRRDQRRFVSQNQHVATVLACQHLAG